MENILERNHMTVFVHLCLKKTAYLHYFVCVMKSKASFSVIFVIFIEENWKKKFTVFLTGPDRIIWKTSGISNLHHWCRQWWAIFWMVHTNKPSWWHSGTPRRIVYHTGNYQNFVLSWSSLQGFWYAWCFFSTFKMKMNYLVDF